MQKVNIPVFEDVTLMINSNIPFLIDADALLMYSFMQKNHDNDLGGQYLHVIYFCERFLNLLLEKGGNCIIVFFNIWNQVWNLNPYVKSIRLAMYSHFKRNTKFKLYECSSFNTREFKGFIDMEKPRCILLDIGLHLTLNKFNIDPEDVLKLNCTEIVFFRGNDLPCIDISEIVIDESTVSSYNLHSNVNLRKLSENLCSVLIIQPHIANAKKIHCNYSNYDARCAIAVIASSNFLHKIQDDNQIKLIMLCYASQEILSLQNRCCPIVKFDQATLNRLQTIVKLWLDCLSQSMIICIEEDIKLDWNTIADLWQGTLFSYMCYIMGNDAILYGDKLGYIQHPYERYMKLISQECKKEIEPYPIKPIFNDLRGKLPSLKYKQCNTFSF